MILLTLIPLLPLCIISGVLAMREANRTHHAVSVSTKPENQEL